MKEHPTLYPIEITISNSSISKISFEYCALSISIPYIFFHNMNYILIDLWLCFHSGRITAHGICGEQLLMTELQQDIQRYRTSEHKRMLLEKYGRKVEESSLVKKPFILNSLNEGAYTRDLIDNLLKLEKIFFLTGIEYPIPGAFLLFPAKDLAYWIDRLSLICEDIHIEETYNI